MMTTSDENDKKREKASFSEEEQLEQTLKGILYRFDCPPIEELRDYYSNELQAETHQQVTAHIVQCAHCSAEVAQLAAFMVQETGPAAENILKRIYEGICLVARQLTARPGLAAVRGEQTDRLLLFEVEDITLSLNLKPQPEGYLLQGRVVGAATSSEGELYLAPQAGYQSPAWATLQSGGKFKLSPVSAGKYQLILFIQERTIIIPELTIGPN